MEEYKYPRLCGGTFFTLVLQGLKQRIKAREHYRNERDGLSDPEVLVGLIRVINPDYASPELSALKTKTNEYKSCKLSKGAYLPFGDTIELSEFAQRVQSNYAEPLRCMTKFATDFLEIGAASRRDYWLAAALIELVLEDKSIDPEEEFFAAKDGSKIKKAAFSDLREVCFPALLLGVWHYAVTKRKNNKLGAPTYNTWCPSTGGGPRMYKGNLGQKLLPNISKVSMTSNEVSANQEPEVTASKEADGFPEQGALIHSEYLEKAKERYNVMKLIGGEEVPLTDFFVCNTIGEKEKVFADKKKIKCAYLEEPTMSSIRNMYLKQRGYDNKRTVLIGSGGCGKSLMLQHLFLQAADKYENTGILPVFLELRYFKQSDDVFSFIVKTVSDKDSKFNSDIADELLSSGRCQLLMDGFDEIDPSDVDSFLVNLEQFSDKYGEIQIVLSSRANEYLTGLHNYIKLYVWPFDTSQSLCLIDKILKYTGEADNREMILEYINNGFLKKDGVFASHPLLLTFVTMNYPTYKKFGDNHLLFYKSTYEALLSGHDDNKKPYDRVFMSVDDDTQFSTVFKEFCAITFKDGMLEFDSSTFETYFKKLKSYSNFKNPYKMNVKNFKHDVCSTACMMYEKELDMFYIDPGFQEFLFAEYYVQADIEEMPQLLSSLKKLRGDKILRFDALDMLNDLAPEKFRLKVLLPFLNEIFKGDDEHSFIAFLDAFFDNVNISVHVRAAEIVVATAYGTNNIMSPQVENYPSTILLEYILKLIGIEGTYKYSLSSELFPLSTGEHDVTGKLIGEIVEIENEKALLVDSKPVDYYEMLKISHKQGYDATWLTTEEKDLLCFGSTITIDTYDLVTETDSYADLIKDTIQHSPSTYKLFQEIKKFHKVLKKEQHRSER